MAINMSHVMDQMVPISDKLETVNKLSLETKWDWKRIEQEVAHKVDREKLIMIESRFRDFVSISKFDVLESGLIDYATK